MPKDISGKVFGRLTALYPTKKRDAKGYVIWHCICKCGKEIDISYNSLRYGNIQSCGCQKKEKEQFLHDYLTHVDGTSMDLLKSTKLSKKKAENYFPFYCAHCGRKLQRTFGTDVHFYCVTPYWDTDEELCKSVRWDRTDIEEVVLEALKARIAVMTIEAVSKTQNTISEGILLRQQLKVLTAELEGSDKQNIEIIWKFNDLFATA